MNIFMYTNRFGVYMAGKLYWRIKKDGKWTWKPATVTGWTTDGYGGHIVEPEGGIAEEEE